MRLSFEAEHQLVTLTFVKLQTFLGENVISTSSEFYITTFLE